MILLSLRTSVSVHNDYSFCGVEVTTELEEVEMDGKSSWAFKKGACVRMKTLREVRVRKRASGKHLARSHLQPLLLAPSPAYTTAAPVPAQECEVPRITQ